MGRKSKISYELKIQACKDYENGIRSVSRISNELCVNESSTRAWILLYKTDGEIGLLPQTHNYAYDESLKRQACHDYLDGLGSYIDIASKYGLRSSQQLKSWVKKYNDHEELRGYHHQSEVYMVSARKTTIEERLEIVKYCLEHNKDFNGTAQIYGCSYSQVYTWVHRYLLDEEQGLADRRGHHKEDSELTEVERLKRENDRLIRQLTEKEMAVELLKKVQEIERRRPSKKGD